jgi:hypothetical protein
MDPLLSFRPLPSNIEHAVSKVLNDECCLCYTGGLDTRSEDVLIVRHIVMGCDAIYRIEVAKGRKDISLVGLLEKKVRADVRDAERVTHYRAESLSWYSLDLLKHSCTPASFHKAAIAAPTSGGKLSPSI